MLDENHGEVMEALGNILEKLDVHEEDDVYDCEACIGAGLHECECGVEDEKGCNHAHDDKCGYGDAGVDENVDDDKAQVKGVYADKDEESEDEDYYEGLEWDNEGFTTDEDDEY